MAKKTDDLVEAAKRIFDDVLVQAGRKMRRSGDRTRSQSDKGKDMSAQTRALDVELSRLRGPDGQVDLSSLTDDQLARALRPFTPDAATRRDIVENGTPVVYRNLTENLHADHIVSLMDVVRIPGFRDLTPLQMIDVANHPSNFMPLHGPANSSKRDRSPFDWAGLLDAPLSPGERQALSDAGQGALRDLMAVIDQYRS